MLSDILGVIPKPDVILNNRTAGTLGRCPTSAFISLSHRGEEQEMAKGALRLPFASRDLLKNYAALLLPSSVFLPMPT